MVKRNVKLVALLSVGALGLAACSTGSSGGGSESSGSGGASGGTVYAGHEQEFSAYNNNTAGNNAVKNNIVLNQVLPSFWEYDTKGEVAQLPDFGTVEKTSDNPLTVEYKINPKAVWSDGSKIACEDLVLQWMAQSGKFPAAKFDPASTTGYEQMKQPECKTGDQNVKVVYEKPFVDWSSAIGGTAANLMPAHVIEKQTGVKSVVDAATSKNAADIAKIAKFWNEGWSFKPGELKPDITPSSGPYMLDSWQAGQSITIKKNPKWWGTPAKADKVTFRFIAQDQQPQSLQNDDIQVAQPQPLPDIVNQLKKASNVEVMQGDEYTYEHLDFNFKGQFKDANLRKAFALCVPRDEIVDKLVKPVNDKAIVLNSRFIYPFQTDFADLNKMIDAKDYEKANIAEAKKLLGGKKVTVRIGHITPNPRRTGTVSLIKASCDKAGFEVKDIGSSTFFDDNGGLDSGDFDVALFAWSGGPQLSSNKSIFMSNGGQNKGKFNNPAVDAALNKLTTTVDEAEARKIAVDVDNLLWKDLDTIPLFAFPSIQAHTKNLEGAQFQPAQSQVYWNPQNWSLKS